MKSFINTKLTESYLELDTWQLKEIKEALREAENQDFIAEKDFVDLIKKYVG
jgi:predicted transcriptional regulator